MAKCLESTRTWVGSSDSMFKIKKGKAWWYVIVLPTMRKRRQEDPWSSPASQLSLLVEFQVHGRYCLKSKVGSGRGMTSKVDLCLPGDLQPSTHCLLKLNKKP